jgi:hypothetical protein
MNLVTCMEEPMKTTMIIINTVGLLAKTRNGYLLNINHVIVSIYITAPNGTSQSRLKWVGQADIQIITKRGIEK